MKKLFFIPLVIVGFFIFLAIPVWAAVTSQDFVSLKNTFFDRNCSTRMAKDSMLGSICYLLHRDIEKKDLWVKDENNKKLGLLLGWNRSAVGFDVYSEKLNRIVVINLNGDLASYYPVYFDVVDCPVEIQETIGYLEQASYYSAKLDLIIAKNNNGFTRYYKTRDDFESTYLYMNGSYWDPTQNTCINLEYTVEGSYVLLTPMTPEEITGLEPFISAVGTPRIVAE